MSVTQNSNSCMMCCTDILVVCCSCRSCSSLSLIICIDVSTDTEVKRGVTSYAVMHSPVLSLMFLMCSMNSCVLCTVCVDYPNNGLRRPYKQNKNAKLTVLSRKIKTESGMDDNPYMNIHPTGACSSKFYGPQNTQKRQPP